VLGTVDRLEDVQLEWQSAAGLDGHYRHVHGKKELLYFIFSTSKYWHLH
jgi:hypothetical protein